MSRGTKKTGFSKADKSKKKSPKTATVKTTKKTKGRADVKAKSKAVPASAKAKVESARNSKKRNPTSRSTPKRGAKAKASHGKAATPRKKPARKSTPTPLERVLQSLHDPQLALEEMFSSAVTGLKSEISMKELGLTNPLDVDYKVHPNADGTIDAELRIRKMPRKLDVRRTFVELEQYVHPLPNTWITTGLRFYAPDNVQENYSRFRGMSQAMAYWQRATQAKVAINFLTARQKIYDAMVKKKRKKPEQIFVRMRFQPTGKKPKRG